MNSNYNNNSKAFTTTRKIKVWYEKEHMHRRNPNYDYPRCRIGANQEVHIAQVAGNKVKIVKPVIGWTFKTDTKGTPLLTRLVTVSSRSSSRSSSLAPPSNRGSRSVSRSNSVASSDFEISSRSSSVMSEASNFSDVNGFNMDNPIARKVLQVPQGYSTKTTLTVRSESSIMSEWVGTLVPGQVVDVIEFQGQRARIVAPMSGWISWKNSTGEKLLGKNGPTGTEPRPFIPVALRVAPSVTPHTPATPTPQKFVESNVVVVKNVAGYLSAEELSQRLALRGITVTKVQIYNSWSSSTAQLTFGSVALAKMAVATKGMEIDGRELVFSW